MIQTWALVVDAYRELSSRKLFWLSLLVSLVVVLVFAAIGLNAKGVTILWFQIESELINSSSVEPIRFYKGMFSQFGVGLWLAWGATILALVSTGGMIPDMIAGGSIELTLSKPISRVRLFLTKYICGLLFTAMQVTVFASACFLVFGLRGGVWIPGVFWAIPFVVLFFSYLFSICVLLGMITRSAMPSILLTILVWFCVFIINTGDNLVLMSRVGNDINRERVISRIERQEKTAAEAFARDNPGQDPTPEDLEKANPFIADNRKRLAELDKANQTLRRVERMIVIAKTLLPKTQETLEAMKRKMGDLAPPAPTEEADSGEVAIFGGPMSRQNQAEVQRRVEQAMANRTTLWVVGTSLAFEAVMVGLAAWLFRRRDF